VASIHQDPVSGFSRVMFRFGGRQYNWSLKTKKSDEADTARGGVEQTLQAIERGWLAVPANADFKTFVLSGGKVDAKPAAADLLTLEKLFKEYEERLPPGTLEDSTLATFRLHKQHLLRVLGKRQPAQALGSTDLQGYVNKRAREKYRGRLINARTIKKEVTTVRQ
jgi:hypothetical protein